MAVRADTAAAQDGLTPQLIYRSLAANARRGNNAPPISPIALEAVKRIDTLFGIEREINGLSVEKRLAARRERSAPLVAAVTISEER